MPQAVLEPCSPSAPSGGVPLPGLLPEHGIILFVESASDSSPETSGRPATADLRRDAAAFVVVAAIASSVVLLTRWAGDPLPPFLSASEFEAHHTRLAVLADLPESRWWNPVAFIRRLDGAYPPALHVITAVLGFLVGQDPESIVRTGLLWLLIYATGIGFVTRQLTGSLEAGLFSTGLALLLPAAQASAVRYYYDLPMDGLVFWGVGLCLQPGPTRLSARRALASVLVLVSAALMKWTAVPIAFAALVANAVAGRRPGGPALVGLLCFGMLIALGGGHLSFASLQSMAAGMNKYSDTPYPPSLLDTVLPDEVVRALWSAIGPERWTPCRLLWHPIAMVRGVLSPLGALVLLPLVAVGIGERGNTRIWAGVVSTLLFVIYVGLLRQTDERLDLPLVGALICVAGSGATKLPANWRRSLTAAAMLGFTWVNMEFQIGWPPLHNDRSVFRLCTGEWWPQGRGLALASTVDGLGWLRRDDESADDLGDRRNAWTAVRDVKATSIGLAEATRLLYGRRDASWVEYSVLEDEILLGSSPTPVRVYPSETDRIQTDVVLVPSDGDGNPVWPFPNVLGWIEIARVQGGDGGHFFVFREEDDRGQPR